MPTSGAKAEKGDRAANEIEPGHTFEHIRADKQLVYGKNKNKDRGPGNPRNRKAKT